MGDSRLTNFALGKYANFYSNTANVFTSGDTTPDVTNGVLFFSNNTSNTTITHFDLVGFGAGSQAQQFEGKLIKVVFLDNSTSLLNAANLILAASDGIFNQNSTIELVYHNSAWIELNRTHSRSVLTVTSADLATVGANTGGANVRGVSVLNLSSTAADPIVLRKGLGGAQGQILTIVAVGGSNSLIIVNSAATDCFVSTSTATGTQFRLANSGSVTFVRAGATWKEITPIWANSSVTYST